MNWAEPHDSKAVQKINGHKAYVIQSAPDSACKGGKLLASVFERETPPGIIGKDRAVTFTACIGARKDEEIVLKIVKSVRFASGKRVE